MYQSEFFIKCWCLSPSPKELNFIVWPSAWASEFSITSQVRTSSLECLAQGHHLGPNSQSIRQRLNLTHRSDPHT